MMFDWVQEFFSFFGLDYFSEFTGSVTVIDWFLYVVKVGISLSVFKMLLSCLSALATVFDFRRFR